jgi:eukaryotic-like serine/threonine-protein kinase
MTETTLVAQDESPCGQASFGVRFASDRFQVGPLLGKGGQARVYLANETRSQRRVALKILLPRRRGGRGLERFAREASLLRRVAGPGTVRLLAAGNWRRAPVLVLEHLPGASLRDLIQEKERFSWREGSRLLERAFQVVARVHARGVIHRDLKPENFLANRGEVTLIDFGLARRRYEPLQLTRAGFVVGTPSFTSPERFAGKRASPCSDVFALGVTAYEVLSGGRPFQGATHDELIRSVIRRVPARIEGLPKPLWNVLARSLNKSPEERYASARALADAWSCARRATLASRRGRSGVQC